MDIQMLTKESVGEESLNEYVIQYEAADAKSLGARDTQMYRTAKWLLNGNAVFDINDAIEKGGFRRELPNIAVARSDLSFVEWCAGPNNGRMFFREPGGPIFRSAWRYTTKFRGSNHSSYTLATTSVPIVPLSIRPDNLKDYFTVFEVTSWTVKSTRVADPLLCKYIGNDKFAVIEVWDMTELEAFATGL